jgi:hypothetical protein
MTGAGYTCIQSRVSKPRAIHPKPYPPPPDKITDKLPKKSDLLAAGRDSRTGQILLGRVEGARRCRQAIQHLSKHTGSDRIRTLLRVSDPHPKSKLFDT